jgi:hypothetical protein
LSEYYEKRLKQNMVKWLTESGAEYVMGIALFAAWLKGQPEEVQLAAPEVLRRAFGFIADKWL